jgi:hypothetical protein
MNQRDLIRLALLLAVLGLNAVLSHYAFKGPRSAPVISAVRVGSYAVLAMALVLAGQACACGRRRQQQHPRLSLENVIVYVYGLGLVIFASAYCLLFVSGDATSTFFTQLTAIAVDDMFVRTRDATLRRSLLFFCAIFAGASNICTALSSQGTGETVEAMLKQNWFPVVVGIVLPAFVPWIYFGVRGKRFYNPVTIYDFLNFGTPFAVILAITVLLRPYEGEPPVLFPGNESLANATIKLVTTSDVATPLLCLNMLPTVFLAIQCTLLYSTVDFLSASAVAGSFKALAESEPTPLVIVAFVSASVAFSVRVYACYRDEDDRCSMAYTRETEEDEEEDEMLHKLKSEVQMANV